MDKLTKAKRVLNSQGRSVLLAEGSMSDYVDRLAALCDNHGKVVADAPERFASLWYEYTASLDTMKATDQDTELDDFNEPLLGD